MAVVKVKGSWIKLINGSWANIDHVDLLEIREVKKDEQWQLVGWNALQPQVEAYVVSEHKSESEAQKALDKLIEAVDG